MLAESREVGVADYNVNVGNREAAAVMGKLAYFSDGSQAPSWSRSGANCSSTHFTVEKTKTLSGLRCMHSPGFCGLVPNMDIRPRGGGTLRNRNLHSTRYSLRSTRTRTLHAYHELSRHRIWPKATLIFSGCTPVSRGSSISQLAVLPLTSSLQDKRERTGNPQAR